MKRYFFFALAATLACLAASCSTKETACNLAYGIRDYLPYEEGDTIVYVGERGDTVYRRFGIYADSRYQHTDGSGCSYWYEGKLRKVEYGYLPLSVEFYITPTSSLRNYAGQNWVGKINVRVYSEGDCDKDFYAVFDKDGNIEPIDFTDTMYCEGDYYEEGGAILVRNEGLVWFFDTRAKQGYTMVRRIKAGE